MMLAERAYQHMLNQHSLVLQCHCVVPRAVVAGLCENTCGIMVQMLVCFLNTLMDVTVLDLHAPNVWLIT